MMALSIRQPWAWLILNAGKDIENRAWPTKFRGQVLVHAGKGMTADEYESAEDFARRFLPTLDLPTPYALLRGGIVGAVEIVDCVRQSESPWFVGTYGFVLRNPVNVNFQPYRGALGFFAVPDATEEQTK